MRYLLRGGPADDQSRSLTGDTPPKSIQHTEDGETTIYVPADEAFTEDGETVHIFEPRQDGER